MKGWHFLVPPGAPRGETALWHGNFWAFLSLYLEDREGQEYCLSPEISLDLQSGETATPTQVIAIFSRGGNNTHTLRFADTGITCSLLTYAAPERLPANPVKYRSLNLMPVGHALARVTPTYFKTNRLQAEVLLRTASAPDLASGILEVNKEAGAARVLGGLETLGMKESADQVRGLIALTGWTKFVNPFPDNQPLLPAVILPVSRMRIVSVYFGNKCARLSLSISRPRRLHPIPPRILPRRMSSTPTMPITPSPSRVFRFPLI